MDGLNMDNMNRALAQAIQWEINNQWGTYYTVDGDLTRDMVNHIAEVHFTSETGGNITYLLQAKLFYKGYYTGELTSRFDENTVAAVTAFQQARGLTADGHMDAPTLFALLL